MYDFNLRPLRTAADVQAQMPTIRSAQELRAYYEGRDVEARHLILHGECLEDVAEALTYYYLFRPDIVRVDTSTRPDPTHRNEARKLTEVCKWMTGERSYVNQKSLRYFLQDGFMHLYHVIQADRDEITAARRPDDDMQTHDEGFGETTVLDGWRRFVDNLARMTNLELQGSEDCVMYKYWYYRADSNHYEACQHLEPPIRNR
ncbi:hypothetical protein B0I35DRAFT_515201 [Stachybotrys elegans]|uniref:Uncharacterized protein n=1 Tax=Stachybotrys elegans TaxID=80388 RepID=A0A8K0SJN4_9HYPO|nr:hypothetical protein B0I35DRAFT_515201 [Stachybotrys elegans]